MNQSNTPSIETKRLILRRFTKEDETALFDIYRDKDVNQYLPWFPLISLEEASILLQEKYLDSYEKKKGYHYAVCLKTDNIPIGYINVADDDSYDFGYALKKEYWQRGIITEASQAVIKQIKQDGDLPYLTATHDVKNPGSGKVMQKIGMHYCYSYEEQWQPKNVLVTFRMYQLNFDNNDDFVYQKYWNDSKVHFVEEGI